MIALLLGIISLIISIMFTTSFDKLANEVRDIRIKYLKIDHMLNLLKLESKSNKRLRTLNKQKVQAEDYVDEENTQQDEYQSALPFTENFQQNNYIKQENIDEEIIGEENNDEYIEAEDNNVWYNKMNKYNNVQEIIEEENDDEYIEAEDNNLWYKKMNKYNNVQEEDYHNNIFNDTDYYDNVNFKERFNQDDIIEEFY
tara:strand:- start:8670 stop:9266 length:597 start_codon:yes stop_codon:yes gene_type:complete